MKKISIVICSLLLGAGLSLTSCGNDQSKVISVAASETPHAEILKNAVQPLLKKKGYTLNVKVLDWTLQNDAVLNGDYDANYFQHRPYLENYDGGLASYDPNYTYKKVFPVATVHFEPLRIYEGKSKSTDFESKKKTATYEICDDPSNAVRALDLLKANGVIDSYEVDKSGSPINLPSNIKLIAENLLAASIQDYDYGVLPANTALTGNVKVSQDLPVEGEDVADLRANVVAANVKKYDSDKTYKAKIDVLADALLDSSVATYIKTEYKNVIVPDQKDLRTK